MNALQRLARLVIEVAFDASVAAIALFNDMSRYRRQVDDLRELERGTLGKAIADSLDARGLTLVPGYESHDLKHALLGYGMTPEGEVRMQAFMIGNRNYSVPSFLIFGFGAALLPETWPILRRDFSNGRRARPISAWTIERYAKRDVAELRACIGKPRVRTGRGGGTGLGRCLERPIACRCLVTMAIFFSASCTPGPSDVDDFGPPSGFARLEGTVTTLAGTPAGGLEMLLTSCGGPIGGLAGRSRSRSDGSYEIRASLPPAAFPSGADSLVVNCVLFAGMDFARSGGIDVPFFPPGSIPTILRVDLVEQTGTRLRGVRAGGERVVADPVTGVERVAVFAVERR